MCLGPFFTMFKTFTALLFQNTDHIFTLSHSWSLPSKTFQVLGILQGHLESSAICTLLKNPRKHAGTITTQAQMIIPLIMYNKMKHSRFYCHGGEIPGSIKLAVKKKGTHWLF